jgi:hypothetical protein
MTDEHVRKLYDTLMQTKQQLNQHGPVNEAALAKSLRNTEAKLRKQYAGKRIDFAVAVQDGKAVIKPVVR